MNVVQKAVCMGMAVGLLMTGSSAFAQDIVLEDIVTAEIEKPQAFYVLRASDLEYESMTLEESFLPELFATVENAPF